MDSSLEGQYANEDATAFVELASKCLQYEARERPDFKFVLTAAAHLQKQKKVKLTMLSPVITWRIVVRNEKKMFWNLT